MQCIAKKNKKTKKKQKNTHLGQNVDETQVCCSSLSWCVVRTVNCIGGKPNVARRVERERAALGRGERDLEDVRKEKEQAGVHAGAEADRREHAEAKPPHHHAQRVSVAGRVGRSRRQAYWPHARRQHREEPHRTKTSQQQQQQQ